MKYIKSGLVTFVVISLAFIFWLSIFNEHGGGALLTNTAEYKSAHGIVDNQVNTLMVGETRFELPEGTDLNVLSYGDIKKHEADVLTVYFQFPEFLDDSIEKDYVAAHRVRVELRHMGRVQRSSEGLLDERETWHTITQHSDLGLTEFRSKNKRGDWLEINFQALDNVVTTPLGDPLIFRCQFSGVDTIHMCQTALHYPNGIHAWIFIPYQIFQDWQKIYTHVNARVLSYIKE